jgi:hypothetical protein
MKQISARGRDQLRARSICRTSVRKGHIRRRPLNSNRNVVSILRLSQKLAFIRPQTRFLPDVWRGRGRLPSTPRIKRDRGENKCQNTISQHLSIWTVLCKSGKAVSNLKF